MGMNGTVFLYAGQGAQKTGMGKSFYENSEIFRECIDRAAGRLPFDLKQMMFQNPDGLLGETAYTQPCLAAFAAGVTEMLTAAGIRADAAAGLSLGEYSALYAAGIFSLSELMEVTAFRGKAMEEADQAIGREVRMTAVLGTASEIVEKAVSDAAERTGEPVWISNYNSTAQTVIAGTVPGTEKAKALLQNAGAGRFADLAVSSAFHTPFMAPASEKLRVYFDTRCNPDDRRESMRMPVIFNAVGREMRPEESIRNLLVRQVREPVQMAQTLRYLAGKGITRAIAVGPGHVFRSFLRQTAPQISCICIEEYADFERLTGQIGEKSGG